MRGEGEMEGRAGEARGAKEIRDAVFLEQKGTKKNKEDRSLFRAWPPHPINTIILALLLSVHQHLDKKQRQRSIANCMLFKVLSILRCTIFG